MQKRFDIQLPKLRADGQGQAFEVAKGFGPKKQNAAKLGAIDQSTERWMDGPTKWNI